VQGLALVFALLVVAITLVVDLIQAILDPRRWAVA
jgi:ABC-type dipeptide/oligopeptide/nickel transport system permease component